MMHDFVLVTDSTADLPAEMISQYHIVILPLEFTIGEATYHDYPDQREFPLSQFYALLRNGSQSKTAQVSYHVFEQTFEEILKNGQDILYIGFSSALSGTYNTACIVAEDLKSKYPQQKILVVDSLCASLGQGLFVYQIARQREKGASLEEAYQWAMDNRLHVCHWFTVDDLSHLKRGGRISSAAALVGTALQIKPVLHVDNEGRLIPMEKIRGRAHSLSALVDKMAQTAIDPKNQVIFISHGDCLDDAQGVAQLVKERFDVAEVVINYIGPVIGTHSGPGTVALFFMGNNR